MKVHEAALNVCIFMRRLIWLCHSSCVQLGKFLSHTSSTTIGIKNCGHILYSYHMTYNDLYLSEVGSLFFF